jgi:creatinine amidohydrolase
MKLNELTWKEAEAKIAADALVLVPVGAIEQHGWHLPLSTDSMIVEEVTRRLAECLGPLALEAPTIHYTPHSRAANGGGDRRFPGSIGIRASLLAALIEALTRDLLRQGYRRVVFISGHFENIAPVTEALDETYEDFPGSSLMHFGWPDLITQPEYAELLPGYTSFRNEHAAVSETSCVLAIRPDLVKHEFLGEGGIERDEVYDVFPTPDVMLAPSGMLGTAEGSTAAIGNTLMDLSAERMAAAIVRDLP